MNHDSERKILKTLMFGAAARAEVYRLIATQAEAGVPITVALAAMSKVLRRDGDSLYRIIDAIGRSIRQGKSVGEAMAEWVEPTEATILKAADRGVDMATALRIAARVAMRKGEIIGAIVGAMVYPVILCLVGTGMLVLFGRLVIPLLKDVGQGQWTGIAAFYDGLSGLLVHHGVAVGFMALVMGSLVAGSVPRWRPSRVREWFDRSVPPYNVYRLYQGAVLLSTIGAQVEAGSPLLDVIETTRKYTQAPWLRTYLDRIRMAIRSTEGARLSALDQPLFSRDVRLTLALSDQMASGKEELARLGERSGEIATRSAKRMGAAFNAIVLFLVGGLLAGFVITVYDVVGSGVKL